MKHQRLFTNVLLTLTLLMIGTEASIAKDKKAPNNDAQVEVGTVVKAVEDALDEAAQHPIEGFPTLQSVTLAAETTIVKEVGGGIKFYIVNLGVTRHLQNVAQMSLELKPPKEAASKFQPSSVKPEDIKNGLARQIQMAKLGFLAVKDKAKNLKTDKVQIQIAFTASTEGNGGIDTGSLLPIGITANGKLSKETGNTITLDFGTE